MIGVFKLVYYTIFSLECSLLEFERLRASEVYEDAK